MHKVTWRLVMNIVKGLRLQWFARQLCRNYRNTKWNITARNVLQTSQHNTLVLTLQKYQGISIFLLIYQIDDLFYSFNHFESSKNIASKHKKIPSTVIYVIYIRPHEVSVRLRPHTFKCVFYCPNSLLFYRFSL